MPARNVNDFTIRVATVNGSGSQSSNLVLTNAIARLGIPVAPKNVFPSNIEGLPTWFDVRVSALGYQCRARDFDVLVALNAATWQQDVAGVKSGGAVIHEESFPCKGDTLREDLSYYAVPFTALAKEHFADKGDLRKYLMNMIYVGAVAQLARGSGIDGRGEPSLAVPQQAVGRRAQHVGGQRRLRIRAAALREARSVAPGADERKDRRACCSWRAIAPRRSDA